MAMLFWTPKLFLFVVLADQTIIRLTAEYVKLFQNGCYVPILIVKLWGGQLVGT